MNLPCPKCGASVTVDRSQDPADQIECSACHASLSIAEMIAQGEAAESVPKSSEAESEVDDLMDLDLDDLGLGTADEAGTQGPESAGRQEPAATSAAGELDDLSFMEMLEEPDETPAGTGPSPPAAIPHRPARDREEMETERLDQDATVGDTDTEAEYEDTQVYRGGAAAAEAAPLSAELDESDKRSVPPGVDQSLAEDEFQLDLDDLEEPSRTELAADALDQNELEQEPAGEMEEPTQELELPAAAVSGGHEPFSPKLQEPLKEKSIGIAAAVPPKRSPLQFLFSALKITALGLLALVAVQLILWWAVGWDPVGLALLLPKPLALVAPEKLRAPSSPPLRPAVFPGTDAEDEEALADADLGDEAEDASPSEASEPPAPPPAGNNIDELAAIEEPPSPEPVDEFAGGVSNTGPLETSPGMPGEDDFATRESAPAPAEEADAGETDLAMADDGLTVDAAAEGSSPPDFLDEMTAPEDGAGASPATADADLSEMFGDDTGGESAGEEEQDPLWDAFDAAATGDRFTGFGPRGWESFSADDVATAVAKARQAVQNLNAARQAERSALIKAAREFYIGLAEVAEFATLANRSGSAESLQAVRELLREIATDPQQVLLVGNSARGWLQNNHGTGVLLAGTVDQVRRLGELHELQLTMLGKEAVPVTVITRLDGEAPVPASGSKILLMAVNVANAADVLQGYIGDQSKVLWATDLMFVIE